MKFRVTSARYCMDEMDVYTHYQEVFEQFDAKIMTDMETGNVSIIVNFQTIEQLAKFANAVEKDLLFPAERPGYITDRAIWIKDGYME